MGVLFSKRALAVHIAYMYTITVKFAYNDNKVVTWL